MIARALRWVADQLDDAEEVEVPDRTGPIPAARNAIMSEDERVERNEAAMQLIDPSTVGYAIFRIHRCGRDARIKLDMQVDAGAWPHLLSAMARVVLAGERATR